MVISSNNYPVVSIGIPLFRSEQFIDNIIANIDAISINNVEILISDRHCHDNAIDILSNHYLSDERVQCFKFNDEQDWLSNINFLMGIAKGKYWRYTPHDDIFLPGSLELLIHVLEKNPAAVLAYGPTEMINLQGEIIKERDLNRPHPKEVDDGWNIGLVLAMYWKGYFGHAFKGLIRRASVVNEVPFIKSVKDQILPERCWLFALCFLGSFEFVPEALYKKVLHDTSVTSKWRQRGFTIRSNAHAMSSYLYELLGDSEVYKYCNRDIWLNAGRRGRWLDYPVGPMPEYVPFSSRIADKIRKMLLPLTAEAEVEERYYRNSASRRITLDEKRKPTRRRR